MRLTVSDPTLESGKRQQATNRGALILTLSNKMIYMYMSKQGKSILMGYAKVCVTPLLMAAFACIPSNLAASENYKPYVDFDAFLFSESVALREFSNNWQGDYQAGGENQIGSLWMESGVKTKQWNIGLLYREEHQLQHSPDTADLYYALENNQLLESGRIYRLALEAQRFRAKGLRVARNLKAKENLKLNIGVSLFQASQLIDGGITGTATTSTNKDYDYNLDVDYTYDTDVLFDRPGTKEPTGLGIALDVSFDWQATPRLNIAGHIKDLPGLIYWNDAPFTDVSVSSDDKTFDEEGFVQIQPVLSGIEGYEKLTQKLAPNGTLDFAYKLKQENTSLLLNSRHYKNYSLVGLGGKKDFGTVGLGALFWPKTHTLQAFYKTDHYRFSLGFDSLNIEEVQTLWLGFKYN